MKSVRTYMNFAKEIDPAHILTMADLELSIALATPLVVFGQERQVVAGLAERWTFPVADQIAFTLRQGLKWSDGSTVTAKEYKEAIDRAKKVYGSDLRALFDSVEKIEAPDDRTLIFTTHGDAANSGILLKLTEPMYGLVALKDGHLDLSKSVGPFFVKEQSANELTLTSNSNWYAFVKEMPSFVEIKRPKAGTDVVTSFDSDPWPTLISGSSVMEKEKMDHIKQLGYKTWQRSLDKVFSLYPSQRFLSAGGAEFIKALAKKIDRASLMKGLTGYADAEQFFPRGYELYSSSKPHAEVTSVSDLTVPIRVLIVDSPVVAQLRAELSKAFQGVSRASVIIEVLSATQTGERMKRGDFDVMATSLAVADPNFEGAMSFFIERSPPFIQSTPGVNDFATQLRAARGLPASSDRSARMREIIIRAQEAGHVLPLFHFSSLAIAKPGVDLSEIPNSDETILFSKVRMR